ncbi:LisH and RanBPM domains containing protein [Raphanus sativus]|nr:LisH and RanBPM domains containing protein [Raphanus sativus]
MMHLVLEKKALLEAIELAQDLIEKNKDLHFHLLCLHFLELRCAAKCPEALESAQTRLVALFGDVPKYVEKLQVKATIQLLTCDFEDPELPQIYIFPALNTANRTCKRYTPMERLLQQVTVARQYLTQEYGKDAFPPFSLEDSLKGLRSQQDDSEVCQEKDMLNIGI